MKREHTRQWYLEQVGEYRRLVPGGSLTTDFIVGFPGETEKDFEDTLRLMEEAQFDSAYVFGYSERPGTPATKLEDDVSPAEKSRRLQELMRLQRAISLKKNQALLGTTQEVLFESRTKRDDGRYAGRTRSFKRVVVPSAQDELVGKILQVEIKAAADETLLGELVITNCS
jgi:tRNA-2-methylthio-N6-dimethylallyladenosine synthase